VPDAEQPKLSVVVPVFGSAGTLRELAARVKRALEPERYELILIDDDSPDDAWRAISELGAADDRISGIRLERNVGQHAAVIAGLAAARGSVCVVMDADLQDPPEVIPVLLDAVSAGADLVFAARRGRHESLPLLVASRLMKGVLCALSRGKVPLDAGLFFAARAHVAAAMCRAAGADPYVLVLAARAARSVRSIPVTRAPGRGSAYTGRMRLHLARRALETALGFPDAPNRTRIAERVGQRAGH
jgi:glycosyltransferase involved in cell wall biosynthesis